MGDEIKLLGMWASPYSRRIELALKLKGLHFDYVEENLANKSDLLLNSNPVHNKVPVLFHNGKPISESLVIIEYIDDTWGSSSYSILPQDPYDRAVARFWAKFVDEKVLETSFKAFIGKGDKEQEDGIEEFTQQVRYLEGELKGKEYFGGERIGFVDIAAFYILNGLGALEEVSGADVLTKEKFPVLFKWMEKLQDHDVVIGCLPPRDKYLDYVRSVRAFLLEAAASKAKSA